MKLQHTLGGLEGLDPITPETRVFVEAWEKTIFGIHAAMMALSTHLGFQGVPTTFKDDWTWADLRKGAEAMNPFDYFKFRYYEKWLGGHLGLLHRQGLHHRRGARGPTAASILANPRPLQAGRRRSKIDEQVRHYLVTATSPKRTVRHRTAFKAGDKVLVKDVPHGRSHPAARATCAARPASSRRSMTAPSPISARPGRTGWASRCRSTASRFDPADLWARAVRARQQRLSTPTCSKSICSRTPEEEESPWQRTVQVQRRARGRVQRSARQALEALLIEKGVIGSDTVDKVLELLRDRDGAVQRRKIVARAWVDPDFKERLLADTPKAIAELELPAGHGGRRGRAHGARWPTAPGVHNLIICTLCSCYPWPVLGLPPYWYKDPTFRARGVREPRAVLREFGLTDRATRTEVKVWDSSAQIRWFVLPERPANTEG